MENYLNHYDRCFICGGKSFKKKSKDYLQCQSCEHEVFTGDDKQTYIINDILDEAEVKHTSVLDKHKIDLVRKSCSEKNLLLDIGSANGKFLYSIMKIFDRSIGVEITKKSLKFSQSIGLEVYDSIPENLNTLSVVTFWHTLEHIPIAEIESIFSKISSISSNKTTIIISVPNNNSLIYTILKERYPYYDVPNHIHQFSNLSLNKLLEKFGFKRKNSFYSIPYSAFAYVQSFLNIFNHIHNYYYYRKKRGWDYGLSKRKLFFLDLYNLGLILLVILPTGLLTLYDMFFLKSAATINVSYYRVVK